MPDLKLKYQDEDGDWIELTDDMDVAHAISLGPILRLKVDHSPVSHSALDVGRVRQQLSAMQLQLSRLIASLADDDAGEYHAAEWNAESEVK